MKKVTLELKNESPAEEIPAYESRICRVLTPRATCA
jgi:hypothetical protein